MDQISRKIIHFNVTQHPVKEWITQQVKEAFPFIDEEIYLIHDNDDKFRYIDYKGLGITPVRTSYQAPNMNAYMERFQKSMKYDCLNHFIFFNREHIIRTIAEYVKHFNSQRPHQGINQRIPDGSTYTGNGSIKKEAILNGLHYHYYPEAA